MTKLGKVKTALMNLLMEFSRKSTDKGLLEWHSDADYPRVDEYVFLVGEDESIEEAADGTYTTDDQHVIVVKDGRVVSCEKNEKIEDDPIQEEETFEDETVQEETTEEEVVEEIKDVQELIEEVVKELTEEQVEVIVETAEEIIETIEESKEETTEEETVEEVFEEDDKLTVEDRISALEAQLAELTAKVLELEKKPAGVPAAEEFKRINKTTIKSSSDERLNNLSRILNAR